MITDSSGKSVSTTLMHQAMATLSANGKTFYWASFFLGREKAAVAALVYSCCRQLDDIADNDIRDKEDTRRILSRIQREIVQAEPSGIHPVAALFRHLIHANGLDAAAVSSLLDGLIQDTHLVRFSRQHELDRYCYRVAGTVGIMMCAVLGIRDSKAAPFAIDLGIAMQLTNISRDVLEDASLARRYLPVDIPVEALRDPSASTRTLVAEAIELQLERAELFYTSGIAGLAYLPRGSRVAIYLAAVLYRAIGRKLRNKGCPWWSGRVMIPMQQKLIMTILALPVLVRILAQGNPAPGATHNRVLHSNLKGLPCADM